MSIKTENLIRVLVSGVASNNAAPHVISSILDGEIFGPTKLIKLHLYDNVVYLEEMHRLEMDIFDCGYPLLAGIVTTTELTEAYRDIHVVLVMNKIEDSDQAAVMDGECFRNNLKNFKRQAIAMNEFADRHCKVVVCVPPINTICFVISRYAARLTKQNISGVSRIDLNRAKARLAVELGVPASSVTKCVIWGNINGGGRTTFPDVTYAQVLGEQTVPLSTALKNESWVKNEFLDLIQARRLQDSETCAPAIGKAIVDHLTDVWNGTAENDWTSMIVYSRGEYDTPRDVFFSFPVTIKNKKWYIVPNLSIDEWARSKISASCKDIEVEKKMAITECG